MLLVLADQKERSCVQIDTSRLAGWQARSHEELWSFPRGEKIKDTHNPRKGPGVEWSLGTGEEPEKPHNEAEPMKRAPPIRRSLTSSPPKYYSCVALRCPPNAAGEEKKRQNKRRRRGNHGCIHPSRRPIISLCCHQSLVEAAVQCRQCICTYCSRNNQQQSVLIITKKPTGAGRMSKLTSVPVQCAVAHAVCNGACPLSLAHSGVVTRGQFGSERLVADCLSVFSQHNDPSTCCVYRCTCRATCQCNLSLILFFEAQSLSRYRSHGIATRDVQRSRDKPHVQFKSVLIQTAIEMLSSSFATAAVLHSRVSPSPRSW